MRSKLTTILTAMLALGVCVTVTSNAYGQDMDTLLGQLCGKSEAPQRDEAALTEAYQKAATHLLPLMGGDDVGARYRHQIMLQDMGGHAARPGAESERQALAKVLIETLEQAEMPNTVRYWIVLQLERIGKGESVPALAKMMDSEDKNLRDCARRALQANPDAEATAVLLKRLEAANDSTEKIGLINTLGARSARDAVGPLVNYINSRDVDVAAAAVSALSKISGAQSARALIAVIQKPFGRMSVDAAQGLLEIARERTEHNDYNNAIGVYAAVYTWATKTAQDPNSPNPVAIRAAALIGLIGCDVEGGAQRAVEAVKDQAPTIRAAAVNACRQAPTKAPTEALAALLPELDARSQVQVLGLVADRGDLSSVKFVTPALDSQDESVRLAAIDTLTAIGGDAAAEAMLEAAAISGGPTQKAAIEGLALVVGPLVDEVIAARAASGDVKSRSIAIGLLARRRALGAGETLLGYAADENEDIAVASFKAMTDVADLVDVASLAELLAEAKDGDIRKSAVAAMRAVLSSVQDEEAAGKAVMDRIQASGQPAKVALLGCLDALGGTTTLRAVFRATSATDEQLRDTAIRTLSNWPDFAAAKPLLDIASKSETSLTHYVLATRGALRLITAEESVSLDDRVALCFQAFDQARRDEEKRAAIAAMRSLPRQDVAERLLALAREETFKAEAALAAVELAGNMLQTDRDAARELASKIKDLNISDEVNGRAEAVIQGRRGRRR